MGVSRGGRSASGTCRRFTRILVRYDLPRMESTSTSSTARNSAAWAYLLFHLPDPPARRPCRAVRHRHEALRPRRLAPASWRWTGTRRGHPRPPHLAKVRRPGRSPRPAASSGPRLDNFSRNPRGIHPAADRSPKRFGMVRTVKSAYFSRAPHAVKRRRHTARGRAHGIRRAGRPAFAFWL